MLRTRSRCQSQGIAPLSKFLWALLSTSLAVNHRWFSCSSLRCGNLLIPPVIGASLSNPIWSNLYCIHVHHSNFLAAARSCRCTIYATAATPEATSGVIKRVWNGRMTSARIESVVQLILHDYRVYSQRLVDLGPKAPPKL